MTQTVDLRQIPLSLLKPTKFNPRHISPDDPKLAELAASIKARSQLQPGICRPHPTQKGCFELLAGCRRWWGCQMAGLETMDVIVKDLDDKTARDVTVLENLQGDDLSPLEEAAGIRMLVDAGHSLEDISARIGKSVRWIKRRSQLTTLIPAWVKMAEKHNMGPAAMELIARYDADMQAELLIKIRQIMRVRLVIYRDDHSADSGDDVKLIAELICLYNCKIKAEKYLAKESPAKVTKKASKS